MAANSEVNPEMTLGEAAGRFLATLKDRDRAPAQTELNRFVRHFGSDSRTADLRPIDVEDYQERIERTGVDVSQRLDPLKTFLVFVFKQGGTETNLGKVIKVRRAAAARAGSRRVTRTSDEETVQLTANGYEELKKELEFLTTTKRAEIARDLYEARIDKDFRENAPFDAAKHHQAEVEARIRQIERTLAVAHIVDDKADQSDIVGIGSTVLLRDVTHDEELTYTLVGTNESKPQAGRISVASPVGRALVDHQVGDEIEVAAPMGAIRYRIERIVK